MAAAVPIVISVIGTYMAYKSQQDAASAQEKIGRENARQQEMAAEMNARRVSQETDEEARRMSKMQSEQEAGARAKAAASGVKMSGSISDYLEGMMTENKAQLDWQQKSGKSKVDEILWTGQSGANLSRMESKYKSDASKAGSYASLIGGAGDIYGYGKGTYW